MKHLGEGLTGGGCLVFCLVFFVVEVTAARVLPLVVDPSAKIDIGLKFEGPLVRRPESLPDEMGPTEPQNADSEGSFSPNSETSSWVSMDSENSNKRSENLNGLSESEDTGHDFSSMKTQNRCIFCGYADCPVCYYLDDDGVCRVEIECLSWEQRVNLRNRVKSGDKAVDIVEAFLTEVKDGPISNSELAQMFQPNEKKPAPHFGTSWLKDMYLEIIRNLEDEDATDFEVDIDSLIISTEDMTKIEENLKKIAITNTELIEELEKQGMKKEQELGTWENLLDFESKDLRNSQQLSISLQLIAAPFNVDNLHPKLSEQDSRAVQDSLNKIYDIIHSYDPQSNAKNDPNSSNNLFDNKLLIPKEILKEGSPFLGHSIKFPFIQKSDYLPQNDPKFDSTKNEKNAKPFIEERNDDGIDDTVSEKSEVLDVNIVDQKNKISDTPNIDESNNSDLKVVENPQQDANIVSVGFLDSGFVKDVVDNSSATKQAESITKNYSSSDAPSTNLDINHPTINEIEISNIESVPSVNSGDIEGKAELAGEISIDLLDVENLGDENNNSISDGNSSDESDFILSHSDDSDDTEAYDFEYSFSGESGSSDSGIMSRVESFLSGIEDTSSSWGSGYSDFDQTSSDEISDYDFDHEYSSSDESTYSDIDFDSNDESSLDSGMESYSETEGSSYSGMESYSETEEYSYSSMESYSETEEYSYSGIESDNEIEEESLHSGIESDNETEESLHSVMESDNETEESFISGMESDNEIEESLHSDMESDNETEESLHSGMESDNETEESLHSGLESDNEIEESLNSGMGSDNETEESLHSGIESDNETEESFHFGIETGSGQNEESSLSDTEFGSSEESLFSEMESVNVDEEYFNSSMESENSGDEYSSILLESTTTDMSTLSTVEHGALPDSVSEGSGCKNDEIFNDMRADNLEEKVSSYVFDDIIGVKLTDDGINSISKLEDNVQCAPTDSASHATYTNLEMIDSSTDADEIAPFSGLELINNSSEKLNLTLLEENDNGSLDLIIGVNSNESKNFSDHESESKNYEFHDLISEISLNNHGSSTDSEVFNFEGSMNSTDGNEDSSTNVGTRDHVADYVLSSIRNKKKEGKEDSS